MQLIPQPELGIIRISGEDAISYLQGQLTCDVTQLGQQGWLLGAHCNAKGKVWSNFVLLRGQDALFMVMHNAVLPASLEALNKFAVFSKVELQTYSSEADVVLTQDNAAPSEALAQAELDIGCTLSLVVKSVTSNSEQKNWPLYFIQQRFPWLASSAQQEQFVPQMLNQDLLGAISFDKGCYIGQETVARMRYLGKQNRALYYLTGTAIQLQPADQLEMALGSNWKRSGNVVNAAQDSDGSWHLLAVLPTELEADAAFRLLGDQDSRFTLASEPE